MPKKDFHVFRSKQEVIDDQMKQPPELHPFDQQKLDQHFKDYVNQPETGSLRGDLSRGFYGQAGYYSRGKKLNPLFIWGPIGVTLIVGGYLLLGWIFEPEDAERGSRRERTESVDDSRGGALFGIGPEDDVPGGRPIGREIISDGGMSTEGSGSGAGREEGGGSSGSGETGAGTAGPAAPAEPFTLTDHDTVIFGHYPHYCDGASGTALEQYYLDYMYDRENWAEHAPASDAIEWIVLEDREDSVLLMSRDVLDVVPMGGNFAINYYDTLDEPENYAGYDAYDHDPSIVTWEDTGLRAWLNDAFIDYAFTDVEQQFLLEMTVDACGTSGGMCNDYVTIPSSANLDRYMPHTGSGDYNFELVAHGTQYALYEQYRSYCGPYRETDLGRADTGFRVLVRRYHGFGSNWAGVSLGGHDVEAAGCPSSLLNTQTVSYWLRDIDTQFYSAGANIDDWMYTGKEGIFRVVTNDGRYYTTGYRMSNSPGPYPFSNETNITCAEAYCTRFAGLRPVILVAKRNFVFGSSRGGEPGTTGRPRREGGETTPVDTPPPPPPEELCTITFDPNGGSGYMDPVELTAGSEYALPECAFQKRSASFTGWDLGMVGDIITVESDLTLRATWAEEPEPEAEASGARYFGHYEQDGNEENGKEPLEWIVLSNNGRTALLISARVLDHPTFDADYSGDGDADWESSTLRTWLNGEFRNEAFSSDEKRHIHRRRITADTGTAADQGGSTRDYISILSLTELYQFYDNRTFTTSGDDLYSPLFMASPTDAILRSGDAPEGIAGRSITGEGLDTDFYKNSGYSQEQMDRICCDWWLRTPGADGSEVLYVGFDGCVGSEGMYVRQEPGDSAGVRPVIEVDATVLLTCSGIYR